MANPVQPTKCKVNELTVKGIGCLRHLNKLSVYESVCKPYLTAKLVMMDNNNALFNLGLEKGDPISFSFFAPPNGRTYETQLYVLAINGNESAKNLRTEIYNIDLIGEEFYVDRKSMVQKSFKGMPGTSAISQIHSSYFNTTLNIVAGSLGPIGLNNPHIANSTKPFTAINDIKKRLTYGAFKSGSTLYFRDRDGHVLAPLEALFSSLSAQTSLVQKATWGADWRDVFDSYNAIIGLRVEADEHRSMGKDVASVQSQGKTTFDLRTMKKVGQFAKSIAAGAVSGTPGFGALLGGGSGGGLGGEQNFMTQDTDHQSSSTGPDMKAEAERLFMSLARGGPSVSCKFPLQTGMDVTVGKGIYLKLIPPIGDLSTIPNGGSDLSGLYLVTDLVHEIARDDSSENGTTTVKALRGGKG